MPREGADAPVLIESGADVNERAGWHRPVMMAILNGITSAGFLIEKGADVN